MTSNKEATRFASQTQESRVARKLGGSVNSNSGAGMWRKGDVQVKDVSMLVECKTCLTPKDSFSIKKDWIIKNKEEAFSNKLENHCIAFNFNYSDKDDYYIIDDALMQFLIEKLREEYE